eukprot:765529-Hanusia_phi.AAC.2
MDSKRSSQIEAGKAKLEKSKRNATKVSASGQDTTEKDLKANTSQRVIDDNSTNLADTVQSLSLIRETVCEEVSKTVSNSISIKNELKLLRESFKKAAYNGEGYLEERVDVAMKIAQAVSEIYESQSKECVASDASSWQAVSF